jgi:flagellum-specific ATP synthase
VAHSITPPEQQHLARRFRGLISAYQRNRDLIAIGAYQRGSDMRTDEALTLWPRIEAFLRQDVQQSSDYNASRAALAGLFAS